MEKENYYVPNVELLNKHGFFVTHYHEDYYEKQVGGMIYTIGFGSDLIRMTSRHVDYEEIWDVLASINCKSDEHLDFYLSVSLVDKLNC